jgi:hypothetical protein
MAASGWLDDAREGLDEGAVYVSSDVAGAQSLTESLTALVPSDGSVGVAVLPSEASLEAAYSTHLLDQLFSGSDYGTLIVAVGGDLQADSRVIDGDEAMRIANESETAAGGDLGAALTETVQAVVAETPADAPPAVSGDGASWLLPVAIGAVVVVAAVAGVGVVLLRRRRGGSGKKGLPVPIRAATDRLTALRAEYARRARQGDAISARTDSDIAGLVANVGQLFTRIDARAGAEQRTLAEVEYADKLGRLVAALESDYLLDLLAHPELWDDPDQRISEVREALTAVSAQLVENIKQVNARSALRFQVSLDSLIGREELRGWEREFKRATDPDD